MRPKREGHGGPRRVAYSGKAWKLGPTPLDVQRPDGYGTSTFGVFLQRMACWIRLGVSVCVGLDRGVQECDPKRKRERRVVAPSSLLLQPRCDLRRSWCQMLLGEAD